MYQVVDFQLWLGRLLFLGGLELMTAHQSLILFEPQLCVVEMLQNGFMLHPLDIFRVVICLISTGELLFRHAGIDALEDTELTEIRQGDVELAERLGARDVGFGAASRLLLGP